MVTLVVLVASRFPIVVEAARAVEAGELTLLSREGLALLAVAVAQLVLSCFLALAWHSVLKQIGHGENIVHGSAWTRVFRLDRPIDHELYVLATLASGAVWSGRVLSFSPDLELDHRELVGVPLSTETASGDMADGPDDFQRIVLRATEISSLAVMYKSTQRLGGRHGEQAGERRLTLAFQLRTLARWLEARPQLQGQPKSDPNNGRALPFF